LAFSFISIPLHLLLPPAIVPESSDGYRPEKEKIDEYSQPSIGNGNKGPGEKQKTAGKHYQCYESPFQAHGSVSSQIRIVTTKPRPVVKLEFLSDQE
jgi:hypothetical protein